MENPLILVIDDSQTIRKMVECHLSQAGYSVALAADAELGLEMARTLQPDLILLDHQLPGTTGDEVCRKLLDDEQTSRVPVVISSAMRNRAFAQYTEFANVVDQIPKPFTPELLKSGVANALQTGAMVVQAQRTGCAMPEAVGEVHDATLEGTTQSFPLPTVLAFPEQSVSRPAGSRSNRATTGSASLWPAAECRRSIRRRSAPSGWKRLSRTSWRSRSAPGADPWRATGSLDGRAGQAAGTEPRRPATAPGAPAVSGRCAHVPGS